MVAWAAIVVEEVWPLVWAEGLVVLEVVQSVDGCFAAAELRCSQAVAPDRVGLVAAASNVAAPVAAADAEDSSSLWTSSDLVVARLACWLVAGLPFLPGIVPILEG